MQALGRQAVARVLLLLLLVDLYDGACAGVLGARRLLEFECRTQFRNALFIILLRAVPRILRLIAWLLGLLGLTRNILVSGFFLATLDELDSHLPSIPRFSPLIPIAYLQLSRLQRISYLHY